MLAAYADIVGTLALIVSGISVYLYWRFRQTEPKQAVRVQKELARHQAETVFLPRFRLEVINALHFLDPPDGWLETSELVSNVHTRFGQLYRTWGEGQHLVSPEVSRAMRELDILGEVRWLEDLSYNTRSDEEIHGRLREVKPRLQRVREIVERELR